MGAWVGGEVGKFPLSSFNAENLVESENLGDSEDLLDSECPGDWRRLGRGIGRFMG